MHHQTTGQRLLLHRLVAQSERCELRFEFAEKLATFLELI
jgi:hypothetical protein